VNLLAPVLLNPETGQGSQVILSDQHWPVQAELRA
jgi:flagellar assembly factor FliW